MDMREMGGHILPPEEPTATYLIVEANSESARKYEKHLRDERKIKPGNITIVPSTTEAEEHLKAAQPDRVVIRGAIFDRSEVPEALYNSKYISVLPKNPYEEFYRHMSG